jgi:hypothetical protein
MFEVRAIDRDGDYHTLRRFADRESACAHALKVDARHWTSVTVERAPEPPPVVVDMPKFPWRVEWAGRMTYIVDADGRRILVLLGRNHQRDLVGDFICAAPPRAPAGEPQR